MPVVAARRSIRASRAPMVLAAVAAELLAAALPGRSAAARVIGLP